MSPHPSGDSKPLDRPGWGGCGGSASTSEAHREFQNILEHFISLLSTPCPHLQNVDTTPPLPATGLHTYLGGGA